MNGNKKGYVPVLALIGLSGAGLASCSLWTRNGSDKITVSGNIELTQVNIAFKTPGRLIELPIDEGAEVLKGTVIARLDVDQLQKQRARDMASVTVAETMSDQQKAAVEFQRASLEADIEARRAALRQTEAKLQELLAGSREQEKEQAKAAAEDARTQHALAKDDWERAQVLFKTDDISRAQYDQFRTRFDSTKALVQQAQERLSLVMEGPRKEDIEAARAQSEQARAGLKQAEATRLELKRKELELQTRRAQIEQARAQVAVVDTQIADGLVVAPINGVVLVKSAEAGEVLAAGTTIATLGEMDRPWLRGYIRLQDLPRVKLGMKAKVTTDGHPGKIYTGRISFISSQAEFTPKQIQTPEERIKLVYRIKIEVENPEHELKLNMPADAEIELNSSK
ncbi:MAG TPA: HlyD family efflux transporter periplasmic adaptor subunit [Acidobacteriota bacterium]|nr:HlyD family efflux transporter periplasmic adaptor subunit [Acidobacteriota bacterium]